MARPDKDDGEKLSQTLAFRLSDSEYAKYEQKIAAAGLSKSQFFREHILNNTTEVVAAEKTPTDSMRALHYLKKSSNNINQLAKLANRENLKGTIDELTMLSILDNLQSLKSYLLDQTKQVKK